MTNPQVIDEIHERDRFADFLLILVRDLLPAHPHLRVVLMSATLHVELFSGGWEHLKVGIPLFTQLNDGKQLRACFREFYWVST